MIRGHHFVNPAEDDGVAYNIVGKTKAFVDGAAASDVAGINPGAGNAGGQQKVVVGQHTPHTGADAHQACKKIVPEQRRIKGVFHKKKIPAQAGVAVFFQRGNFIRPQRPPLVVARGNLLVPQVIFVLALRKVRRVFPIAADKIKSGCIVRVKNNFTHTVLYDLFAYSAIPC